jgi:hypothetical protein
MRFTRLAVGLAAVTFMAHGFGKSARAAPNGERVSTSGCALSKATPASAPTQSCMGCHTGHADFGHPVDVDYGHGPRAASATFRSPDEAVRRGVLLPNGRVTCLTCHDPASPWKNHIALPPDAKPSPTVEPRDRATYELAPNKTAPLGGLHDGAAASAALELAARRGERPAVSAKSLCLSCHALD